MAPHLRHIRKITSVVIFLMALAFYSVWSDRAPAPATGPIQLPKHTIVREWTSTRDMSSDENAEHHFEKHGDEFGFTTEFEYVAAANDFIGAPPPGTLSTRQTDGDTVYFNPTTDWFAVVSYKGQIRTFYKLNPKIHGYRTNTEYFNAQAQRR